MTAPDLTRPVPSLPPFSLRGRSGARDTARGCSSILYAARRGLMMPGGDGESRPIDRTGKHSFVSR